MTTFLLRPDVGAFACWFVVLMLISINRLWSLNEQLRAEIADGFVLKNADTLPDLRLLAFVSALLVMIFLPLALFRTATFWCPNGETNCLFRVEGSGLQPWVQFSFDLVLRVIGFFGLMEVYGPPSPTAVQPTGMGLHLVMIARLVIAFVFLSTPFELYRISSSVGRAVRALSQQADTASRIGVRAIGALIYELRQTTGLEGDIRSDDGTDANLRARNAAIALGRIASTRAIHALQQVAAIRKIHDRVRRRALDALTGICNSMISRRADANIFERWILGRYIDAVSTWVDQMIETEVVARKGEGKSSTGIVVEALLRMQALLSNERSLASDTASNVVWLEKASDDQDLAA